jgi:hypothetical protein
MESHRFYKTRTIRVGEFKNAFEQAVTAVLGPDSVIRVAQHSNMGGSDPSDITKISVENLRSVTDLTNINLILGARADPASSSPRQIVMFCKSAAAGAISCCVTDEESERCREQFVFNLGLEETTMPIDKSFLTEVESIVSGVLEKNLRGYLNLRKLRCFISFKFDDDRTAIQVERLKRLLTAVRTEWVTGEQYEPRRVEDKVKAKLRADIDFIIAVITNAGASTWLRDELADAEARGLSVVVLLEDGATFDKGIHGTLEYIPYKLVIDQAFIAVLEGINYIRADVESREDPSKART